MKTGFTIALPAAAICLAASAATYKVDLDRPGGLYRCGETATFRVTLLSTNSLVCANQPCASLDNFGVSSLTNIPFDVSATGVVFSVSGTLREPGFLRLSLPPTKGGRDDPFVFSAGFEPEKIVKGSPSPADFDAFWVEAKSRLAREVPLDPQVVRVPERSTADFDFYRISFATFGRRVHGYMSVPTDKSKAPFPVDIGVNAAGFGSWTNDMSGEKDSIRVQFSVYPFAPDWEWKENGLEAKYKAMDAELKDRYGSPRYCQAGITESRESYFFYPVILGIDRAVDWVAARPDVDRSRFRYEGTSQGGGFGFYLCGLNRAFTRAAFYVPAITDTMGYLKGRDSGWPKIVESNSSTPERRAAAEKWAPYFDGANFASRITCPVRVAVGFSDTTCPPCAVYAAFNEIKVADKSIGNGIGMTHSCSDRFYTEFGKWVKSSSLAAVLSTGVEIPEEGVPTWISGMQYTTRMEKRPAAITNEADYLKWKWRTNLADPKTGVDNDALREGVKKIVAESGWKAGKEDWYDVAARCFDFLVDNVAIGFSKYDCFPAVSAWDRHQRPMSAVLWSHAADVDDKYSPGLRDAIAKIQEEGRAMIRKDFDHSAPDWVDVLKLGFPGMKARVDSYTQDTPFYRAEKRTAAAIMRFIDRLIAEAKREYERLRLSAPPREAKWLEKEIASLERLRVGPPQTVFDIMEFTMVYFILSEPLNYFQVRTFDNIDVRWWPYYQADLAAGRTTEAEFREEFRHFLWQFGSIDNYWGHPMYLGGTNKDGTTAYNPLSLIILDVVEKTALPTPKFQLKMAKNTPDEIWWKSLDMLRKHCPLCLMSEENMARSMKPVGLTDEECRDLLVWGCFEYLPRAKGNCTSAVYIYLPQPVVELMAKAAKGEFSAASFDDFKREYFRILHENTDRVAELVRENEKHLAEINPALVLSLALGSALEKGVDAFSLGYKYNFTTLSECGFATAVDSLLAVKEFVYDKKAVSLAELGKILEADWRGHESLRLRMKNSKLKWGCGNPEADALAKELIEGYTSRFVGTPNGRGGVFVCYGLNSRGFYWGGRITGATPDGRRKGEHLSKNMAPSVGAETEGITGSIKSYGAIAPENFPCGSIYDVMIHPSTVKGDKGLRVFRMLVERFYAGGGVAMNINVVSPETLRDAQKHPEKYENLQVRVAGWNIRWNDIPRKEQDEYIARIETVGGSL